jgi:tetratricopeptide (TPR) repeat protein
MRPNLALRGPIADTARIKRERIMRKRIALCALLAALAATASRADEPDEIAGCASYRTNKTGSDAACDAAIAAEKDAQTKSILLLRRAYMEDAAGDFKTYPKALADLDAAIKSWPQNPSALHERGYLKNEYGRWKEAEADLDAQIAIAPADSHGYQERAMSRFGRGDLKGTLEDHTTEAMLSPSNARAFIGLAIAQMWVGDFVQAGKDLDEALDLAHKAGDQDTAKDAGYFKTQLTLWSTADADAKGLCLDAKTDADFARPNFIGDCTRAFLDAKTAKEKADALTQRSMELPVVTNGQSEGLDDLRLAYALVPDDPDHPFNLGSRLQVAGHFEEALHYLDMSIARRPSYEAFAARASVKIALGDPDGAFADGKKSLEMKPNAIALEAVGDAVYAKTQSYDQAKAYWIGAYRLGTADDGLVDRLKKAGVPIPPPPDAPPAKTP